MRRFPVAPWRRAVQVAAFVLAGPWLAVGVLQCPFGVPFVSCLSCPVTTCRGVWLLWPTLAALGVSQLLMPRAFCGWLCPLGFIEDGLAALFRRRRQFVPAPPAERVARSTKYVILGLVIGAAFVVDFGHARAYDYVVRTPRILDVEAARVAAALGLARYPVRWLLFGIGLAGSVLVARFWCRYLCPLGAVLALARPLSLSRLHREAGLCRTCAACQSRCAMRTTPGTPECTACHDCADRCHSQAVAGRWRFPWSHGRGQQDIGKGGTGPDPQAVTGPAVEGPATLERTGAKA